MAGKQFFTVTWRPPFRDISGRFTRANRGLLEEKRKAVRTLGALAVKYNREEAPRKSGRFAASIMYRTFITGEVVGFNLYSAFPLGKWIREGTRRHIIRARRARVLVFYWEKGPLGPGVYFYPHVRHPGTKKNPYHQRAYRRLQNDMRQAANKIARYWKGQVVK